ncbi:MAG: VWA domain-containing protein [Deltaproteobacteria bacterium]|nr:VWA domain-containing protein [Deltaproteobacteria bacterium]
MITITDLRLKIKTLALMILAAFIIVIAVGCEKSQGAQSNGDSNRNDDSDRQESDNNDSGSDPEKEKETDDTKKDTDPKNKDSNSPDKDDSDTCANLDLKFDRQPSTIMLVVDHSASMNLQLGDTDTRWSLMVKTLMGTVDHPESGLVWSLEKQVNFGLVLFTAKPETCPMLQMVSPEIQNGREIAAIFKADDETYKGASPVPAGIDAAVQLLAEMEGPSKKVIVLATDGDPQTCDNLAVNDDAAAQAATVAAVENAYSAGISTFIVGMADAEDTAAFEYLQRVANAGLGLNPDGGENATFHQGLTEKSLVDAITQIITEEAQSCIYELNGKGITEGEESKGTVFLDDKALELNNAAYGWRLKSETEIELLGGACDDIQIGTHHLSADFPCEVIVILE